MIYILAQNHKLDRYLTTCKVECDTPYTIIYTINKTEIIIISINVLFKMSLYIRRNTRKQDDP